MEDDTVKGFSWKVSFPRCRTPKNITDQTNYSLSKAKTYLCSQYFSDPTAFLFDLFFLTPHSNSGLKAHLCQTMLLPFVQHTNHTWIWGEGDKWIGRHPEGRAPQRLLKTDGRRARQPADGETHEWPDRETNWRYPESRTPWKRSENTNGKLLRE